MDPDTSHLKEGRRSLRSSSSKNVALCEKGKIHKTVATSSEVAQSRSSPIYRLPIETLQHVFHLVLRPLDPFTYYRDLYDMVLVCKRWSDIIQESARFWFLVRGEGSPSHYDIALSRSKGYPLTIDNHNMHYKEKTATLLEHIGRWEDLLAYVPSSFDIGSLCTEPAPLLRKVTCVIGANGGKAIPDLFGGQASNLQYLRLYHCWLDFSSPTYQQLRLLGLADVELKGVSIPQFLQFLCRCKELTLLDLVDCRFDFEDILREEDASEEIQEVVLPTLRTLQAKLNQWRTVLKILKAIKAPRCKKMKIRYQAWESHENIALPVSNRTPAAMPTFRRIVAAATHITVTVKYEQNSAAIRVSATSGERTTLDVQVNGVHSPVQAAILVAEDWSLSKASAKITAHLFLLYNVDNELDDIPALLSLLPSTTELILQDCGSNTLGVPLAALSNPHTAQDQRRWLCPDLKNLQIVDCKACPVEQVVKMLNHRCNDSKEVSGGSEDPSSVQPPRPLEQLVIEGTGYDEELWELVSDAAGPQTLVVWDSDAGSESSASDGGRLHSDYDPEDELHWASEEEDDRSGVDATDS